MPKVAVLILAAGASTRMGKPKQLLPWKNTTLLGHAILNAKEVCEDILVVLGANHEKIAPVLPPNVKSLVNVAWQAGMGTSIALGVTELEKTVNPDQILITLVDQPLIDSDYLKNILAPIARSSTQIVATSYANGAGVPAVFPKQYFGELKKLGVDHGAKHLIRQSGNTVIRLDAGGKAVDLDTPLNYDEFWKRHGKNN